MKKIVLFIITALIIVSLTACGDSATTVSKPISTPKPTQTAEPIEKEMEEYYSFLKEVDSELVFDFTIDEFLANYNRVKSSIDTYKGLEQSDFIYIDSSTGINENTKIYGCPLTILGRNNGINIMLEIGDDTNTIKCISLGIQDYYVYQNNKEYLDVFEAQYSLLMEAVGLPYSEVSAILSEMDQNEISKSNYGLYTKGLAMYYQNVSGCGYYRIVPLTKEYAESVPGIKEVMK